MSDVHRLYLPELTQQHSRLGSLVGVNWEPINKRAGERAVAHLLQHASRPQPRQHTGNSVLAFGSRLAVARLMEERSNPVTARSAFRRRG